MIDKRPIDRLRDGAISLEVKTPDDDSAISIMITVSDRLLVVKEKGIYEIKPADKIDPDRKNIQSGLILKSVVIIFCSILGCSTQFLAFLTR
jgi:hypothetical protein